MALRRGVDEPRTVDCVIESGGMDAAENSPAEQMLPRVVPVHGHDPRRMTCQVHDLFPGTHVVERNDGGVTRRGQKLAGGRKGHGAGGFDET